MDNENHIFGKTIVRIVDGVAAVAIAGPLVLTPLYVDSKLYWPQSGDFREVPNESWAAVILNDGARPVRYVQGELETSSTAAEESMDVWRRS